MAAPCAGFETLPNSAEGEFVVTSSLATEEEGHAGDSAGPSHRAPIPFAVWRAATGAAMMLVGLVGLVAAATGASPAEKATGALVSPLALDHGLSQKNVGGPMWLSRFPPCRIAHVCGRRLGAPEVIPRRSSNAEPMVVCNKRENECYAGPANSFSKSANGQWTHHGAKPKKCIGKSEAFIKGFVEKGNAVYTDGAVDFNGNDPVNANVDNDELSRLADHVGSAPGVGTADLGQYLGGGSSSGVGGAGLGQYLGGR